MAKDIDSIMEFHKENHTFFLASVDGDQPEIRPFGAICKYDGKLYFQTAKCKAVYKQIKANPKVSLIGWDGKANWLRITGEAVEDESVEASEAMFEAYPSLKNKYSIGDGNNTVFYLVNGKARFCTYTGEEDCEF